MSVYLERFLNIPATKVPQPTATEINGAQPDAMPYGGVKASGLGREGLKYTIEEMTEPRLMVINRLESEAVSLD